MARPAGHGTRRGRIPVLHTAMVTDPPPMELTRQGRTYYLAHFNAYRAIYSPHAPPAEPPAAGGSDGK